MKHRVLFLCTGNSARSQIAEAIVNHERGAAWEAVSAGTEPAARVNPYALRALAEVGIDTAGSTPTHISAFLGQSFDLVITVCDDAAENCPFWPGQGQRVHIGFPDPAKATGTDDTILATFRETRDAIHTQILAAVDNFSS
ncbi:MAG: arsenate reductase ArsC [Chloroflexi bacterium]|nr:arsenate reductase ArsC [Chloroflexota bacterium]